MFAYPDPGASCHLCGSPLVAGVCRRCDGPPPRWPARIASWAWRTPGRRLIVSVCLIASVVVLVLTTVGLVFLRARPSPAPSASATETRTAGPGSTGDPASLALSTFEILGSTDGFGTRERRGYAFVVRSGGGTSILLTDYHLVVDDFMQGYRTVDLRRGDQTFSATVVAVSPDPHVALLRIRGVYPALPISPVRPRLGDTVSLGEPASSAARPAAVLDYPGPGGEKHLAFSITVSNGEDGEPVLNAANQVVGIAEPTSEHGVQGVGFAVPIRSACQVVPC